MIENYVDNDTAFALNIKHRLEAEGFSVELRRRRMDVNPAELLSHTDEPQIMQVLREIGATTQEFVSQYDMCMIVLNMEAVSNVTTVRVNWKVLFGLGKDIPWYVGEMPLVVVSTANPYHPLDIPMAQVCVNAYSNNTETLDAVFDKLMGRSAFKGVSPVDPFCSHGDCRL